LGVPPDPGMCNAGWEDDWSRWGWLSFSLGSATAAMGVMPAPIPWSDLEGPCETSILWPEAADALKPHQAHVIVTIFAELDPMALSALLTQVTASVLATTPAALGVYWGSATLIIPKRLFIDFAVEVLPKAPALQVWVDFRVFPDGDRSSGGFTHGLAALGHMEFEAQKAPEPPPALWDRLYALTAYVTEKGPVINDGDTVGEDAQEKTRVVYSDSVYGHEGWVMRLEYERASQARPWWKLW